MKTVIAPIIACVLTGSFGYWIAGDVPAAPETKSSRVSRIAIRNSDRSRVSFASLSRRSPEPTIILASVTETASTTQPVRSVPPVVAKSTDEESAVASEGPIEDSAVASVDDDIRFTPTTRPATPPAQHPPLSDEKNVDTGKPVHEWQRLTDDWFGLRPRLDDRGVSVQASLTMDWSKVLSGGVDTEGSAFRNLFNLNITLDTERLIQWKGGTLFIDFQNQAGKNGAESVGDLQGISNIDADGRTQISELWYEQILLDGKLRLKAGKVDANGEFNHTPDADEFVNGTFGAAPTILGFPTYPDPATSFNIFFTPNEHVYLGLGVYDGSTQAGRPTGSRGPAGCCDGDYFYIGEGGLKWTTAHGLAGTVSAGLWHHTADFDRFDGGTDSGTTGEYLMLDHQIWRENPSNNDDAQGIGLFAKYSHADADVSDIEQQLAGGLAWTGPIPQRDDDILGMGVSWARLSDQGGFAHNSETIYECFYRMRLNAWFSVKPDVQYIHNAADGGARNSVVGTVRVVIDF